MNLWGILLVFAGVVVAVNVLVVALCTIAARSDAAMERLRARTREEQSPGPAEGAARVIARSDTTGT